ncbi:MAG: hypothetical protein OEZ03_00190 [Alphaproteobacteria bacterium]|nr:hypothetical protein [Alphaproteobacteria bacterium]
MTDIMNKAFEALKALPKEDRDRIAWEIIERVEDKSEWDRLIVSSGALRWLEKEAASALKKYKKMTRPLDVSFVSVDRDAMLREDAYWRHFDDLPAAVRKLATSNYELWKKNPNHPSLRFKRIHPDLPIFSFRVGMRHRAVGVRADDERIVWFWMGSFEHFRDLIGADAVGKAD